MFKNEDEKDRVDKTPRPVALSTLAHPVRRKFRSGAA